MRNNPSMKSSWNLWNVLLANSMHTNIEIFINSAHFNISSVWFHCSCLKPTVQLHLFQKAVRLTETGPAQSVSLNRSRLLVYCLVSSGWGSLSVHAEALVSWTRRHQYWRAGLVHFLFYTLADGSLTCVVWGWLSFKIILVFIFIQVQVTVRVGDLKERSLLIPQVKSTCNVINWV